MRDCLIKTWIPAEYYRDENGIEKIKEKGKYEAGFTKPAKFHKWISNTDQDNDFHLSAVVEYQDGSIDVVDYTKIKFKPI